MTAGTGFAMFDTAIGRCGVVYGDRGIARIRLPGTDEAATRDALVSGLSSLSGVEPLAPPAPVREAIAAMIALLAGEGAELGPIVLDLHGVSPFHRRIYEITRAIQPGSVRTYGEVAALAGTPDAARAVGQALGRNPFPIVVPCHRVLAASGRMGGFSAPGGVTTKLRMLAIERAVTGRTLSLFDDAPARPVGRA